MPSPKRDRPERPQLVSDSAQRGGANIDRTNYEYKTVQLPPSWGVEELQAVLIECGADGWKLAAIENYHIIIFEREL